MVIYHRKVPGTFVWKNKSSFVVVVFCYMQFNKMGERSEMKYYQGKHIIQKTVDKFSLILAPLSAS